MIAHICHCEDTRDTILSVCQCDAYGHIEHEVIIQRSPEEFEILQDQPGPMISCDDLDLDLAPGPEDIVFAGSMMTIVLNGGENIEVDISRLDREEQCRLKTVARKLFR